MRNFPSPTSKPPITKSSLKKSKNKAAGGSSDLHSDDLVDEDLGKASRKQMVMEAVHKDMDKVEKRAKQNIPDAKTNSAGGDYGHDYVSVTIKKVSERNPGVQVEKTEGKFLIKELPDYEKRIAIGDEVLAINGTKNINTVVKAQDLINQTKGHVILIVNFDQPKKLHCPCCKEEITSDGKHLKKKAVDGESIAESEMTNPSGNLQLGTRKSHVKSISEIPAKYNIDEYDSESDESSVESAIQELPRRPESKYAANDKFIVTVTKTSKNRIVGLRLLEHEGDIYVSEIRADGLFYMTPIQEGDKILSVNGKKSEAIKNAPFAEAIMEEKNPVSLYVLRPDPNLPEVQAVIAQLT